MRFAGRTEPRISAISGKAEDLTEGEPLKAGYLLSWGDQSAASTFMVRSSGVNEVNPGMMSVKITYESFPPYQTVVGAPGMGEVLFEWKAAPTW
jgi:hypothetical protein